MDEIETKVIRVKCNHCNKIHLYTATVEVIMHSYLFKARTEKPTERIKIRIFTCPITEELLQVKIPIGKHDDAIEEVRINVLSVENEDEK